MKSRTTSTEEQMERIEARLAAIEKLLRTPSPVTVSVPDAAKMLGVSAQTVYNLIHSDDFPCIPVGSRRVVSVEALHEWVNGKVGTEVKQ